MRLLTVALGIGIALPLAACAGEQLLLGAGLPDGTHNVDMNGRWVLAAPNAPSCGMHFSGAPGAQAGAVEPEGGCPGDFFTSRRWQIAAGTLSISDHEDKPLGQMKQSGGRFAGKAADGTPVALARSSP